MGKPVQIRAGYFQPGGMHLLVVFVWGSDLLVGFLQMRTPAQIRSSNFQPEKFRDWEFR